MVQSLSWLTPEEHAWLTHPREGLHTVCKFLPTPADVHEFLREKRARLEAIRPAPTTYRRLTDNERGPWDDETDYERKKRVVRELLGYDPDRPDSPKRNLVPPTAEEVRNLKLRTQPAPPSRYLVESLAAEGWPFIPGID